MWEKINKRPFSVNQYFCLLLVGLPRIVDYLRSKENLKLG